MPLDVSSAPPQTTPRETRLADYRPPAFLVDTVELAFDLDEAATRVRSRLALRRNPRIERDERAACVGRRGVDPVACGAERRGTRRQSLSRRGGDAADPRPAGRGHAGDRDPHRTERQHRAFRPLHIERQLLHAVRGRRLPTHHVFPRSSRRDGTFHHHDHCRQGARAGDAVERQSRRASRTPAMVGIASPGPIRTRNPATCSLSSPATWSR